MGTKRLGVLWLLAAVGCHRTSSVVDAGPRATPSLALGSLSGGDAGAVPVDTIGVTTLTNDYGLSLRVEYAAQPSPRCIAGVRVTTLSAGTCNVDLGTAKLDPAGESVLLVPLGFVCSGDRPTWDYKGSLQIRCDLQTPPMPTVEPLGGPAITKEERRPILKSAGPALSASDRATLETRVVFAKGSAKLAVDMARLVADKAKIVRATPGFVLWVTGMAEDARGNTANFELSERRSDAVMNALLGAGVERARLNRFAVGSGTNRGSGVAFEVKSP